MANEKILVVDDEEDILELVRFNLAREGYTVICTGSGEEALELLRANPVDLIVLDLMLPGIDGYTVARQVNADSDTSHIPIVMLTAKSAEADVITGLEIGAEDYVVKPFSPKILVARIQTILRRNKNDQIAPSHLITHGKLRIDLRRHEVAVDGAPVKLTYTEFAVMSLLAAKPGWAFSRSQIVDKVRGYNYSVTDRSVDVQIVGLRRKLGECGHYIETVRGVGYRFKDNGLA